jgi:ParB/RepB/Spo0J family partition protein
MELKTISGKDLIPSEWNPRSEFDEEKLELLRESIKGIGLVEPLVVRPYPNRKGKYLITAGERRWRSNQDNGFLCLVREESDLDAKVACLVENYVRENIADEDHEKFINDIFKEGIKNKKWDSQNGMSTITGMPESVIRQNIDAYIDRQSLSLVAARVTTTDMIDSKPLKDKPKVRKILLERRAKDEIRGSHAVRNWAIELNELPEDKALDVVKTAKDFNDVKVQVEIFKGIRKPMFAIDDEGLSKLERIKARCERIVDITPAFINTIKNIKERKQAMDILKGTYEHLHKLLIAMDEIEVVDINDKAME